MTFVLVNATIILFAQSGGINNSINELNGLYANTYRFSINSEKQLEVAFYNSSGHFRNDVVYLDFLDPEMIVYNTQEKAISIRCNNVQEKCIDKELFKLDVVRQSSRINIKEENANQANEVIVLLRKIISLYKKNEREQQELGETQRKG